MAGESFNGDGRLGEYVAEFQKRRETSLAALCGVLRRVLERVRDDYAPTAIVEARVKSAASFAEKCLRKRYQEPFRETTDLCAGRIVCSTLKEKRALRDALVALFHPVDEYENTTWRHDADSFGYLGYHMIVHFSQQAAERMARRWGKEIEVPECVLREGTRLEIQVRTYLEHAHADITHDRLYKSGFDVPENLLRKSAIVAAQLESADKQLQRLVDAVEEYGACAAASMKSGVRAKEIECLKVLLDPGLALPGRGALQARKIRLERAAWNWREIVDSLGSADNQPANLSPELAGELGYATFRAGVAEKDIDGIERAAEILEGAIVRAKEIFDDKKREGDGLVLARLDYWLGLAYSRSAGRRDEAVECLRKAHELNPGDPFILVALVKGEWAAGGAKPSNLALSLLEGAAERCIKLAKAGIDTAGAWLALAQIRLLQCDARRAFAALALAAEAGASSGALAAVADDFARIRDLPGGGVALKTLSQHLEAAAKLARRGRESLARGGDIPAAGKRAVRTILFAGNTAPEYEDWVAAKGRPLAAAFDDFPGTVLSGGSPYGVCKVALRCATSGGTPLLLVASGGTPLPPARFRGYLPQNAPAIPGLDAAQIVRTRGADYSILEPIQMWKDVFSPSCAAEAAPPLVASDVALLCLGGGEIAFLETMLAVAVGADAYFLRDSRKGGAADSLAETLEMAGEDAMPHLHILPDDDATLAMFRPWNAPSSSLCADEAAPSLALARKIHENYVRDASGPAHGTNLAPWEELREDFKLSNIHQALNAIRILGECGYEVRPAPGEACHALPEDAVEKMARMEHGRWNVERLMQGWRSGAAKDSDRRISPCIVPWDALSEEVKDYDRRAVRGWPALLLEAGLAVCEKKETTR